MMRSVVVIFCVCCVATLLSEAMGIAFLWYRGQLTAQTLADIRTALSGQQLTVVEQDAHEETTPPSYEEVRNARALRILELNTRRDELNLLKKMVAEQADQLVQDEKLLEKKKEKFQEELKELKDNLAAESTQKARKILLSLSPEASMQNLMQMSLQENIVLLKGMSEKDVAEILDEFSKGDEVQAQRGRKIFEALSHDGPSQELIDKTLNNQLTQEPADNPQG